MINHELDSFFLRNRYPRKSSTAPAPNSLEDLRLHSDLPWLKVDLSDGFDFSQMLKEAKSLEAVYVPHRAGGGHQGWNSLCLHGIDIDKTQAYDNYGYASDEEAPYRWTSAIEKCPEIRRFLDSLGYDEFYRVRLMRLDPGGYILPHADDDKRQIGALNVALNQPAGCEMALEEWGQVPFREGEAYVLNIGNTHSVRNRSAESRYHLIVHGHRGAAWDDIVRRSSQNIKSRRSFGGPDWSEFAFVDSDLRFMDVQIVKSLGEVFSSPLTSDLSDLYVELKATFGYLLSDFEASDLEMIEDWSTRDKSKDDVNALYVLLPGGGDLTVDARYTALHEDGRMDFEYHRSIQVPRNYYFYLNSGMDFSFPKDDPYVLLRISPLAASKEALDLKEVISANGIVDAKNDALVSLCLKRAWLGFNVNPSILEIMGARAIHHYTLPFDIRIVVTTSEALSESENEFFLDQRTQASLMPLPLDHVPEWDLDAYIKSLPESVRSVIVVANGNYIVNLSGFVYEAVRTSQKLIRDDVPVMGHIMDFQGVGGARLPYLHSQFLVLNRHLWLKMGAPAFEDEAVLSDFPAYTAAEEKFHDHYTPLFLEPNWGGGRIKGGRPHFATHLLAKSLAEGLRVENVPESFREMRSYSYPTSESPRERYRQNKMIQERIMSVANQVYVFNVHDLRLDPFEINFKPKELICVASGLNPLLLRKRFPSIERTIFFDRSYASLQYWKDLSQLSNYDDLVFRMALEFGDLRDSEDNSRRFVESELGSFVDSHFEGSREKLMQTLASFKNSLFLPRDMIAVPDTVADLASTDASPLFWISNIYYANINSLMFSRRELSDSYEGFVRRLASRLQGEFRLSPREYRGWVKDEAGRFRGMVLDDRGLTKSFIYVGGERDGEIAEQL